MKKLLIADDNEDILEILTTFATAEGYDVTTANDGEETLVKFFSSNFDMILLDVMMPKLDGFEVCKKIREVSNIPIILITAKGEDYDRIMGLDTGADDYVVKPFSAKEVMARIRAVLRRLDRVKDASGNKIFRFDNLTIDTTDGKVTLAGENIDLTRKEFDLLLLLTDNKGRAFSREHLLESLWGLEYEGETRTVDTHIKRLRAKLDKTPHPNWKIKTVWGVGYSFEVTP
ncbi:MAG: response regulator transcription factor [Selenomonadaceae bacterium]|nr:response regulator transcription factor [Selenomonadaceae bacterium]